MSITSLLFPFNDTLLYSSYHRPLAFITEVGLGREHTSIQYSLLFCGVVLVIGQLLQSVTPLQLLANQSLVPRRALLER